MMSSGKIRRWSGVGPKGKDKGRILNIKYSDRIMVWHDKGEREKEKGKRIEETGKRVEWKIS